MRKNQPEHGITLTDAAATKLGSSSSSSQELPTFSTLQPTEMTLFHGILCPVCPEYLHHDLLVSQSEMLSWILSRHNNGNTEVKPDA